MYYHARRFVDDHQGIVFIDNIEWYFLRLDCRIVLWSVEHECDDIPRLNLVIAFNWFLVDMYKTSISSLLNTISTGVLQFFEHELIHPEWHLALVHSDAVMLVKRLFLQRLQLFQFHFLALLFYRLHCLKH